MCQKNTLEKTPQLKFKSLLKKKGSQKTELNIQNKQVKTGIKCNKLEKTF